MIKFAPKQQKHIKFSIKKEKRIYVFKYLLTCAGVEKNKHIDVSV